MPFIFLAVFTVKGVCDSGLLRTWCYGSPEHGTDTAGWQIHLSTARSCLFLLSPCLAVPLSYEGLRWKHREDAGRAEWFDDGKPSLLATSMLHLVVCLLPDQASVLGQVRVRKWELRAQNRKESTIPESPRKHQPTV